MFRAEMRLGLVLLTVLQAIDAAKRCDQEGCSSCEMPRYLPFRDCPKFGFDCGTAQDSAFKVTTSPSTGCARLSCADPRARLFVDGRAHAMLRCRDWRWQFGRRACDSSSHALCAKPCTYCSSEVPSFLPAGKFNKPMITSASATRQCETASCGADSFLYGVGARGAVSDRILEDELACTGDARWRDSDGTEYDYAVCGEEKSVCQDCKPLAKYTGRAFYSFVPLGTATRTDGRACSRYRCSNGEVLVKMTVAIGEIGDLSCSFDGKWKINGIPVNETTATVACVKSSTACSLKLDAQLSKFQSPDLLTGNYKYQHDPLVAKPCPGGGTFYYLENEGDRTFGTGVKNGPAVCDAHTGQWMFGGKYYYQIACAKRDCKGCAILISANYAEIDNSHPGFKYAAAANKKDDLACSYYACTGKELAIIDKYGARKVKSLTCGRDGTWLVNGIRPTAEPLRVACVADCSSCNSAVTNNTLAPPDFAIKSGNPCLRALNCPKGKFFVKESSNSPYTELSAGDEALCETDGTWKILGNNYYSIACSKRGADCTGNCQVPVILPISGTVPGFYKPENVALRDVEKYDELFQRQSCHARGCPPPFSLVIQTTIGVLFTAKQLKCEADHLWFDHQDTSSRISGASCMGRHDNCKQNFPFVGANYSAAIIEMNTNFHMAVNECPGSSKYYYLKDKWATPTESTDKPFCKDGLWQVGSSNAEFIGCKEGCSTLKILTCPSGMVCLPEDVVFANDILKCRHGQLLMSDTENGPVKEELTNRCILADDPESTLGEWSKRDSYYTCAFAHSDACYQSPRLGYGIPIKVRTVAKKTVASCGAGYELRARYYGVMGSEAICVFGLVMNGPT